MKCPTCLESFTSKNHTVTTECGHLFHEDCIQSWLETGKTTCPKCRMKISRKTLIRLFLSSCDEKSEVQEPKQKKVKKRKKACLTENPSFHTRNENRRNHLDRYFQPRSRLENQRVRHRWNEGPLTFSPEGPGYV